MGLIGNILKLGSGAERIGGAVESVAEVFVGNRAKREEAEFEKFEDVLKQYSKEFQTPVDGVFDRFVNSLNRMPRPLLAIGTLGLFGYSMVDPAGFSSRMHGLNLIPEPLWWLLGVIVSFYFGAREMHHFRAQKKQPAAIGVPVQTLTTEVVTEPNQPSTDEEIASPTALSFFSRPDTVAPNYNAALEEWRTFNS